MKEIWKDIETAMMGFIKCQTWDVSALKIE